MRASNYISPWRVEYINGSPLISGSDSTAVPYSVVYFFGILTVFVAHAFFFPSEIWGLDWGQGPE